MRKAIAAPWLVPKAWQKLENYPDPNCMTVEQIAWEFLRRNNLYREKYRQFQTLPQALRQGRSAPPDNILMKHLQAFPPAREHETLGQYRKRNRNKQHSYGPAEWIPEPSDFHLAELLNPESSAPTNRPIFRLPFCAVARRTGKPGKPLVYRAEGFEAQNIGDLVVRFNAAYDVKHQLQSARKELLDLRQRLGIRDARNQKDREVYRTYWRLLDADYQKERRTNLLQHFFLDSSHNYPDSSRGRRLDKAIKTARSLASHRYILIALL